DAIGGVVNVVTAAPEETGLAGSAEAGPYGFARVLVRGATVRGADGFGADLNVTRTDGWRRGTAYDRQTGTVRWDRKLGPGASLKTVASFSRIDQATAGSSAISLEDYLHSPE